METCFTELASTELSDQVFFEEVFLHYLHYLYPASKQTCIEGLAEIRHRYNQKDAHTLYHLRDKIEGVLYRYHQLERDRMIAETIQLRRRLDQLERLHT